MEQMVFIALAVLVVAGLAFAVWWAAKKRREELAALAARLGLRFFPEKDHALAQHYHFLDRLRQGSNRYAFNVLRGRFRDFPVLAFDYHYETYSTDNKGHTQTHHHHFSFFILELPRTCPELTIAREGWMSKFAQAFGYDDIDFESAEFSRKFCVRSRDKRFAYDVCHARMMEYLLANDDLAVEVEEAALALGFGRTLDAAAIERNLGRLADLRSLLPPYLFDPR